MKTMKTMKNSKLEKQNRHLLWLLMEHSIGRYLLSNTYGRINGYEKAERHIELSAIFIASKLLCSLDSAKGDEKLLKIHDATRELTDNLDSEIRLPLDDSEYDHNDLARKFFDRFLELAEKEWRKDKACK